MWQTPWTAPLPDLCHRTSSHSQRSQSLDCSRHNNSNHPESASPVMCLESSCPSFSLWSVCGEGEDGACVEGGVECVLREGWSVC